MGKLVSLCEYRKEKEKEKLEVLEEKLYRIVGNIDSYETTMGDSDIVKFNIPLVPISTLYNKDQ